MRQETYDNEGNIIYVHVSELSESEKTDFLSDLRDRHLYGGITVVGIVIGTDDLTQSRIMAARILAKENPDYTVRWKLPAGFATLDAVSIITIADATRAHVQACFEAEATVLTDISEYATRDAIEAAYEAALSV